MKVADNQCLRQGSLLKPSPDTGAVLQQHVHEQRRIFHDKKGFGAEHVDEDLLALAEKIQHIIHELWRGGVALGSQDRLEQRRGSDNDERVWEEGHHATGGLEASILVSAHENALSVLLVRHH